MIIYNITTKLDWSIAHDWLAWMKNEHIPLVMATNKFEKFQFVKLLDVDDADGPTYAVQYFAASIKNYDEYIELYAPEFRTELFNKWGNNFIAFRSLMEIIC